MRVAYFGRPGSYSHQAAIERFGKAQTFVSCPTHPQVLDALTSRKVDVGVLPIENSVAGVVMESIDVLVKPEFIESRLKIREYLELSPQLCLLSKSPLSKIRRIYSHPYPLRYLSRWIKSNLPRAEVFETVSTSEAAQLASETEAAAAIASPSAGKIYKLTALRSRLGSAREYITRFCVITRQPLQKHKPTHAAVCFGLRHRPGSLVSALSLLADHRLNLTRILSRPLASRTGRFKPDSYLFWVDVELGKTSVDFEKALRELKRCTTFLDVVGEYSIRTLR